MKALIVSELGEMKTEEIAVPDVGPYDALVQIEACGICNSTDARLIDGTMYWAPPFPFVLGHESVGKVVEVGAKVRNYRVGDRVTRPMAFWPGSREGLNVANGGFSEYGIVRDASSMADNGDPSLKNDYIGERQIVVSPSISARDAALAISLSETASVYRSLPGLHGKTILVIGTGVAGLAFMLWAKLTGARVIALGRREERLNAARKLGADVVINTKPGDYLVQIAEAAQGKVDGMIEAVGDTALANSVLALRKPEGFSVSYGVAKTNQFDPLWQEAIVEEHKSMHWVTDLIERGWVKPEWFLSHTWSFDDVVTAFDEVRAGKVVKGIVQINAG